MAHEKVMHTPQAKDERSADGGVGETVLDFLWGAEAPASGDESAQSAQGSVAEAAEEGLPDALARYARWLQSWGGPA